MVWLKRVQKLMNGEVRINRFLFGPSELPIIWIGPNERRVHLPYLKRGGNTGLSGIVEQEHFSSSVDCFCRINPRCDDCPPTLSKAFDYRMIHLENNTFSMFIEYTILILIVRQIIYSHLYSNKRRKQVQLTSILRDKFSPSSTGTKLP